MDAGKLEQFKFGAAVADTRPDGMLREHSRKETPMATHSLSVCYDGVLALMDLTEQAIDRQDVHAVCALNEHLAQLMIQIAALGEIADPHPAARPLACTIHVILDRLAHNQARIACWLEETGVQISRLAKGATAVHGYVPSVRPGTLLATRNV